jgi:prepilin-type N-terminal cleavage/methylation domain-containing protein
MMKKFRGFTLIELLVVISVISLLMAILIPVLRKAQEYAREVVCRSNLRAVGIGVQMYLQNYDDKFPDFSRANGFFWYDSSGNLRSIDQWDTYWGVAFKNYVTEPKVFGCPSFQSVSELIYPVNPELIIYSAFGINPYIGGKNAATIRYPSSFIIANDHVEPRPEQGSTDMLFNDGPGTMNLKQYRQGGARARFYRGIFRHHINKYERFKTGGWANVLWLDDHVDSIKETTGDNIRKEWYTGEFTY